ncbi:MAG: hypothetical protein ABFR05_07235 [Bacteroidota bacterium]
MKNKLFFLSFSLIGLFAFAQQTTNVHLDKRIENENIIPGELISISINDNVLVLSEIDEENILKNNTHEFRHDAFRVDESQMGFNKGVYTLNDYAYNYTEETLINVKDQS